MHLTGLCMYAVHALPHDITGMGSVVLILPWIYLYPATLTLAQFLNLVLTLAKVYN
jgi:hypothetical protein